MTLFRVDDEVTSVDGEELWPVYDEVFGDHPSFDAWRGDVWDRHRTRPGFRLARAYDDCALLGFAYGYTGEAGQWWTDNAREVLPVPVADRWVGGHFEVVSLGVVAARRGEGVGRRLLRELTNGLPHDRLLLMTSADGDDPARRLYDSEGWHVLGPGVGQHTVIMGKQADR
jgi:ribosomal protein S18 acetylase RimI-like enzyme